MQRVLISAALCLGLAAPVLAQDATPGPGSPASRTTKPKANWTLKHHVSLQVSGGYDLDVFGSVLANSVGTRTTSTYTQTLVVSTTAYPDVFVRVPKRSQVSLGFGIFRRDELFARISRATYVALPLNVGIPQASMVVALSPYKEQSVEFGLRHYFNTGSVRRIYVAMSGGQRTIQAISGAFTPGFGDPLGVMSLYDASKVKTISVEFGTTFEIKHIGFFIEGGGRWQGKLTRNDGDLALWGLNTANDTGGRLYMPVQFGVVFRL
jgi:hypothetical protein